VVRADRSGVRHRAPAGGGRLDRVEHDGEAASAGVDDARLGEHGELLGCAGQGDAGGSRRCGEDVTGAGIGALGSRERSVRRGAGHGEDGALDRRADRGVAGVGGRRHGGGDGLGTAVVGAGAGEVGDVGPEHLAEDHAGVAARAHERGPCEERHALLEAEVGVGRAGGAQLVAGGRDGEEHVGAGVAVGDRVDVEGVDLLTRRGQGVGRDVHEPRDPVQGDAVGDWLHRVAVLPGLCSGRLTGRVVWAGVWTNLLCRCCTVSRATG
jgi:hypothetical protein